MGNTHSDGSIAVYNNILPKLYDNVNTSEESDATEEEHNITSKPYKSFNKNKSNYEHYKNEIFLETDNLRQIKRRSVPSLNFLPSEKKDIKKNQEILETQKLIKQELKTNKTNEKKKKKLLNNIPSKKVEKVNEQQNNKLINLNTKSLDKTTNNDLIDTNFTNNTNITPTIKINGQNNMLNSNKLILENCQNKNVLIKASTSTTPNQIQQSNTKQPRAKKMDSRKITAYRHLERPTVFQQSNFRRLDFLVSSLTGFVARSLDEAGGSHSHFATDLQRAMMKPLNVNTRNSPLKQVRTHSFKNFTTEESVLSKEHGEAIRSSWKLANDRLTKLSQSNIFGMFVFEKVFLKQPKLKELFGISNFINIFEIPASHSFARHARIFSNIIDLAVRNVDELETEIAPALFTYGKRHYQPKLIDQFNNESVRMVCAEIVHAMLDLLDNNLTFTGVEAWIEMVRYMGASLLSGFEYQRLESLKKLKNKV